ncbi:3-methyladenine DNA glycosylase [Microbacterium thalli]|uniref:3-methyladenine DNA glycosylase n=1 Tax=Microbacterium thalli TaxID=3027921 RepID=A0ABT5SJC1_9MICO|nr:3-methyladenine DNA glycosylase [Microbacterium thalli]MDD7962811.1 3-methyladenine DNA glycosylase [Microbacterium thalli]
MTPTLAAAPPPTRLSSDEWRDRADAHAERADALTAAHRARSARGQKHPVEDFLFTYYSYKPAVLRRWHPGAGVVLEEAGERAGWRWYAAVGADGARVDDAGFRDQRGSLYRGAVGILRATLSRNAAFGCFGLHEWAMVYRAQATRHAVPLRLGGPGTDAVVEAHDLRCTHFDAFRFFTPEAVPRNRDALQREGAEEREQPGCLHAGMDVYKWIVKLSPLVPGELLLDAFELARDIRTLDMRASPYDLSDWGYSPVPIETAEGKAEYVRRQRELSERGQRLRRAVLAGLDAAAAN